MFVIGLTGGIASGKSIIIGMLRELGVKIIDADLIAREIVEPGQPAWQDLVAYFGPKILQENKTINRQLLGRLAFGNEEARKALNNITHPRVIEETKNRLEKLKQLDACGIVAVDMPLLIEVGFYLMVDEVWVILVDELLQMERLCARDQLTWEEARQRIAAQMPLAQKLTYADRVIDNNGELAETKRQVYSLIKEIRNKCKLPDGAGDDE